MRRIPNKEHRRLIVITIVLIVTLALAGIANAITFNLAKEL
jgi:flagellar basal body-associated protein FliL